MKIGLITLHYSTNYGAVLQSYYTQEYLKSLGYDLEIIDYRPPSIVFFYFKHLFFNKRPIDGLIKFFKFTLFFKKNYILSKTLFFKFQFKNLTVNYDVIIVGSDEVWNIRSHRKFNPIFFLSFVYPYHNVISFASSAGSFGFDQFSSEIRLLLQKFDIITVRDDVTMGTLSDLGIPSKRLLDPTLLFDVNLQVSPKLYQKNYALVYGHIDDEEYNIIKEYANENKLFILSLNPQKQSFHKVYNSVGVSEWLNLLQNATVVFTYYFHGVIFNFKFRNNVFYLGRDVKDYKIKQLIDDLFITTHTPFIKCSNISLLSLSPKSKIAIKNYRKIAFNLFSGLKLKSQTRP